MLGNSSSDSGKLIVGSFLSEVRDDQCRRLAL